MWLERTKIQMQERRARNAQLKKEREERAELRRKQQEERERRQKLYEEQQEKKRLEQQRKQQEWEQRELKKVERHPYAADMEMCDFLINFCGRTAKEFSTEGAEAQPDTSEQEDTQKKRIADFISQGKVQELERVEKPIDG